MPRPRLCRSSPFCALQTGIPAGVHLGCQRHPDLAVCLGHSASTLGRVVECWQGIARGPSQAAKSDYTDGSGFRTRVVGHLPGQG